VFSGKQQGWDKLKINHKNLLRPTLGHPQQEEELHSLQTHEEERHLQYLDGVKNHTVEQQELAISQGKAFIERLAKASEQLLLQFDNLLIIDDVEKGRVPATKYPTSELLRRKNANIPLEDREEKEVNLVDLLFGKVYPKMSWSFLMSSTLSRKQL